MQYIQLQTQAAVDVPLPLTGGLNFFIDIADSLAKGKDSEGVLHYVINQDTTVTGGTYSAGTITFRNNSGTTFTVNAIPQGVVTNIGFGNGISVNSTDPTNPIISYSGVPATLQTVLSSGKTYEVDNGPFLKRISIDSDKISTYEVEYSTEYTKGFDLNNDSLSFSLAGAFTRLFPMPTSSIETNQCDFYLPKKPSGGYTLATTVDIPTSNLQKVIDSGNTITRGADDTYFDAGYLYLANTISSSNINQLGLLPNQIEGRSVVNNNFLATQIVFPTSAGNTNKTQIFNIPEKSTLETFAMLSDITNVSISGGTGIAVNNTNPQNPIVSYTGITATTHVTVTKAGLDTLISTSGLTKGTLYKVTGVHPTLYSNSGATGTTIYVTALENNKIGTDAVGEFYNPKYNIAVNDFGIWNNVSHMAATAPTTGVIRPNETITANNGATATLLAGFSFNRLFFTVTSGDWTTATSAVTSNGVGTNLSGPVIKSYSAGTKVNYGGYVWVNNTGAVGSATNILTLDSTNWTKVPYNTTDYNLVYDPIIYDYTNNVITKRTDEYNNTVQFSFRDIAYFNSAPRNLLGNPINVFQWGNRYSQSNFVYSSYLENVNAMGEVGYNQLYSQSIMNNNFMFTNIVIVEQANVLMYHNYLSLKSEMRNNRLIDGASIFRNTLTSSSQMSSNLTYNYNTIDNNFLDGGSSMNSNEIRRAVWTLNRLKNSSTISSNLSNYNTGHIRNNDLEVGSSINSNVFNNVYVQAVGSDRQFIYNNKLNFGQINGNTLINISNGRGTYINNCILLGDNSADNSADTQIRLSGIYNSTIAAYTQTTYLRMCTLRAAQMTGVNIDNGPNDFRYIDLEDYVWNLNNTITTNMGRIDGLKVNGNSMKASFNKTFNGSAGNGAIGNVVIPPFQAPTGFFIEEVLIDVTSSLTGTGAIINLGLATDNPQSGINDTIGDISVIPVGITRVLQTIFYKATAARYIVMEVKNAAITSGTIGITLKLSKI